MKHTIQATLFITLLILSFKTNAQKWEWAASTCGGSAKGVAIDSATNSIYVTGYYETSTLSFDSYTLSNNGLKDIFIAKYDTAGNVLWAKSFGGTSSDQPNELTIDKDGNIYIVGTFESSSISFGTISLSCQGNMDAFLLKLDMNGNVLWVSTAGNTDFDRARAVVTDSLGNVYVVGEYKSSALSFDSFTLYNTNTLEDIYIAKYNSSGAVVWANSYGAAGSEYALDVEIDNKEQAIYVTGSFGTYPVSFDSYTLTGSGIQHVYVLKSDLDGNIEWADSPGGTSTDWGKGVAIDANSNIYFSGYFSSSTVTFQNNILTNAQSAAHDIYLVKYDKAGNVKWANRYGETGYDWGYDISATPKGNVFMTGYYNSTTLQIDTITLSNSGNYDIWLAEFDSLGSIVRAESIGGSAWDAGIDIASDKKGNAYVIGGFGSTSISLDSISLTLCSSSDMFIAKWGTKIEEEPIDTSTGSGISSVNKENEVFLYPNPATDKLNIDFPENTMPAEVKIYNTLGVLVYNELQRTGGIMELDIRKLPAGIYSVVFKHQYGDITKTSFICSPLK